MKRSRGIANDLADSYSTNFRKIYGAKSTDYFCSLINAHQGRFSQKSYMSLCPPPYKEYGRYLLPSAYSRDNPLSSLCTQWINTVYNYDSSRNTSRVDPVTGQQTGGRGAFTAIRWTVGGRRLVASTTLGDFVLWNGHSYTMESRVNHAHEGNVACRVLVCSEKHDLMLSADDAGLVKLWKQSDFQALGRLEAHVSKSSTDTSDDRHSHYQSNRPVTQGFRNAAAIRDLSMSSSEEKFVSGSRDGSARIWDSESLALENKLQGHGGDVLSVHWHPHYALLATSSSDSEIRLWDPRALPSTQSAHLATLNGHDLAVNRVRFCPNNYYSLLSASKDSTIRLWDIRMLKTTGIFSGHVKEPSDIAWHPHHRNLFASVGFDGTLAYWVADYGSATKFYKTEVTNDGSSKSVHDRWVTAIPGAHGNFRGCPTSIQSVCWHPVGHVIATSAFDGRLWSRTLPGTEVELRYNENQDQSYDTTRTAEGAKAELYKQLVGQYNASDRAQKLTEFIESNKESIFVGSGGTIYLRPSASERIRQSMNDLLAESAEDDVGNKTASGDHSTMEGIKQSDQSIRDQDEETSGSSINFLL